MNELAGQTVKAVERTGNPVQVGYCWRFSPSVDKMQEVLKSGRLGKVLQVRAHGGCSHDEAGTSHMAQPGDIGGAMFVISCHLFDRVILHFGMPKSGGTIYIEARREPAGERARTVTSR